jgi:choline dehydrogenase-like flavoprotein
LGERIADAPAATPGAAAAWLRPVELRTLEAVCEALVPPVTPPGEPDPHGLYARSARDLDLALLVAEALARESMQSRAEIAQLLRLLGSPLGGLMLAGQPTGFAGLSPTAREGALRRMGLSPLPQLRRGFAALKRLTLFLFYAAPAADGHNPNWPALGYRPAYPAEARQQTHRAICTLPITRDTVLNADAVVVGSGAGGGVVAAELAAAGLEVVVLEKGGYLHEADFSGQEAEMTPRLYLRRGLLTTHDLGVIVLAGSTLGGGTVVNWSTSLRTEDIVLHEWEQTYGLTGATSDEYRRGFEVVERRLGVNTDDSVPNRNNEALRRGCAALGYEWRAVPRNASGCAQRCGACGYGCPYGRKQSTLVTFLQDASDQGARTVVDCNVRRVLIERGRAVGVEGWVADAATGTRHRIEVRAPRVVVAAGGVEAPALLLRSGLDNPNIGRHLRLHPVAAVACYYAEPIEPWAGSLQTVLSPHFAHLKDGYGLRIEVAPAHPGMIGLTTPWEGGWDHKRQMTRAAHEAIFIALVRDTGEGRVVLDRGGEPILHYWPCRLDRYRLTRGMQEMVRIAFAGGAQGAATLHMPRLELRSDGGRPGAVTSARLEGYLDAIARAGIVPNRMPLFSAHQMGSCRLGADSRTAVADPYGEVYGVRGLYISDASGFPTASGVNPMISIMALAYRVAQGIKARA